MSDGYIAYPVTGGGGGPSLPVSIANGGTGETTASAAINALLPPQTGDSGKFLTTNGTSASWGSPTAVDSFTIFQTPAGTYPTALTPTSTMTFTSNDGSLTITGNSSTNTIDFSAPDAAAITALTGDGTATGPGSSVLTLATVNTNTGSFGSSTAIPSFTVNGKGLITAASTSAVVAPAGTLTGTTLASNVVTSSLTSVGTIATGVWNGTVLAPAYTTPAPVALTESTGATTITWTAGSLFTLTLNANLTITFAGAISGQTIVVRLTNTTSNYTVTWPSMKWPNGSAPTQTIGAHTDVYTIVYDGANYYGNAVQNF